jgi:PAS domain S-box-containing protein
MNLHDRSRDELIEALRALLEKEQAREKETARILGALRAHELELEQQNGSLLAAQAELRASEARYRAIIETADEGVWTIDAQARTTLVNPKMAEMLGYTVEEMLGKPLFDFMDEKAKEEAQAYLGRRQEGLHERHEFRFRRKDGKDVWAFIATGPLHDSAGGFAGALAMITDITDRKRDDELLRAAVRAKDDLLAIVSHDLRNPLSAIQLSARSLSRPAPELERRSTLKPLEVIQRSVERMNRLIDDLLQASTMEAGTFRVSPEAEAAGALVEEALRNIEPVATARSIRLRSDVESGLPPVRGDRLRLLQVLSNLLGNAVKFVPEGGTVQVRARAQGEEVLFAVSDDGPGIPADHLPHLFDRYWKGAAGERRGVGLGLFIAKGIVAAHGGRIWVESEAGAGSTFLFTLPVSPSSPDRSSAVAPAPLAAGGLRGVRVLIVDDEVNAASALASLLADEGLRTIEAASGEQALARIGEEPLDGVVLDMEMPGMSGLALLRRLRDRFPLLPAVIVSGDAPGHERIEAALDLPGVAYLAKPLDLDLLLATLGRLVRPKLLAR